MLSHHSVCFEVCTVRFICRDKDLQTIFNGKKMRPARNYMLLDDVTK